MRANLGWTCQVLALLIVGAALPYGLTTNDLKGEVAMLGFGGGLFLLGRWLQRPGEG